MKKIIALTALLLSMVAIMNAQTAEELKNLGNESYKANDFASAYTSFSKAVELNSAAGVIDTVLTYNTGYCAYKSKQYDASAPYFKKAIELGYKAELSYVMLADSYKKANKNEDHEMILNEAFAKYPSNKNLIRFMADFQFKQGLSFYNKASEIVTKADKIRETDAKQFAVLMEEAKAAYSASIPFFLKTNELKPDTKNLPEALSGVYEALGNTTEAAKWKALIAKPN